MNKYSTLPVLAVLLALGGCLSGEESSSNSGFSETPTGSQNNPPRISGSPESAVMVGDVYNFVPTASDADGDAVTFSVSNKPDWATFDPNTGRLTGQPTIADVGVFDAITIAASDGNATATLQAFSIEVTNAALGSITLSWSAPTQNEDGSALTDLAGYKLYYGKTSGAYTHEIRIDSPGISTYVIDNLLPATYYIVATSFNSSGVESRYSSEAVKQVSAM